MGQQKQCVSVIKGGSTDGFQDNIEVANRPTFLEVTMGLTKSDAVALGTILSTSSVNQNSAIILGAPETHFTKEWIQQSLRKYLDILKTSVINKPDYSQLDGYSAGDLIPFKEFFKMWGLKEISVIDIDNYEGADYLIDLNSGDVPAGLVCKYDLVIDAGTLEHCFNLPHALKIIDQLLRPGGICYHSNPANQMMDHGFYQISPTLYRDYYLQCAYELQFGGLAYIQSSPWYEVKIDRYTSDIYRSNGGIRFTKNLPVMLVIFAAQKLATSKTSSTIIQRYYKEMHFSITVNPEVFTYPLMPKNIVIRRSWKSILRSGLFFLNRIPK